MYVTWLSCWHLGREFSRGETTRIHGSTVERSGRGQTFVPGQSPGLVAPGRSWRSEMMIGRMGRSARRPTPGPRGLSDRPEDWWTEWHLPRASSGVFTLLCVQLPFRQKARSAWQTRLSAPASGLDPLAHCNVELQWVGWRNRRDLLLQRQELAGSCRRGSCRRGSWGLFCPDYG